MREELLRKISAMQNIVTSDCRNHCIQTLEEHGAKLNKKAGCDYISYDVTNVSDEILKTILQRLVDNTNTRFHV